MTAKRLYYLLLGTIGLSVVILLAGAYVANLLLQSRAKLIVDAQTKNLALEEKQQQLHRARDDIEQYQSLADIAKKVVPQDKDQAQTVREIVKIAEAHGVKLGGVTFPSSTLGGSTGSSSKTSLSQLEPVKGIPGVYSLEITVQSDPAAPPEYSRFLAFLDALEHNRRTASVQGITLQPVADNQGHLTFTLSVSEYIKP